jgi:hypothetical protein
VGTGGPPEQLPADLQKKWDDYVASLDTEDDRKDVSGLWDRADLSARRKLIEKIPPPMKDDKELEKPKPLPPLSAEEMKRWDDYVATLKGEEKKKAEDAWRTADLEGKRKLLRAIPDR